MNIIKNYSKIATSVPRQQALDIINAGINRVMPGELIKKTVGYNGTFNAVRVQHDSYDLLRGRIFVVGGGKANGYMAEELERIIGPDNITAGLVTCTEDKYRTKKIKIKKAGSPLPDRRGEKAVGKMMALKEKYQINEKDLIICLISGGASALMPFPVKSVSLKEKLETSDLLLSCGANISEINCVRKHLSMTKGGLLARHFAPARVVSLIISDVTGNLLDVIGSGPTAPDTSTFSDAVFILEKYNIWEKVPASVSSYLKRGVKDRNLETPKKLSNAHNYILADNATALGAMALKAKSLGLGPMIVSTDQIGDPEQIAVKRAKEIRQGKYKEYNCLLIGGETTPKLPSNHGRGGRNLHYTAVTMLALKDYSKNWTMASVSTDGFDYIKEAAGAIVDNTSLGLAEAENLNISKYLTEYDTYKLFKKMSHSVVNTGYTGTNVGDIMVYII